MSKSKGNVVAPDAQINKWGADAFRSYLMFLGPWDQGGPYDLSGVVGTHRWLNRLWQLVLSKPIKNKKIAKKTDQINKINHSTLKKVTLDIASFKFNTMIAALMELTNELSTIKEINDDDEVAWDKAIEYLCLMIAPSCPHIAEELWHLLGKNSSVHLNSWPIFIDKYTKSITQVIPIQINGKLRAAIEVSVGIDESTMLSLAQKNKKIAGYVQNKNILKVIYIQDKLLNIVITN
jgi:leucyl-tRNA synthetase